MERKSETHSSEYVRVDETEEDVDDDEPSDDGADAASDGARSERVGRRGARRRRGEEARTIGSIDAESPQRRY